MTFIIQAAGDNSTVRKNRALIQNAVAGSFFAVFGFSVWPFKAGIPVKIDAACDGRTFMSYGKIGKVQICPKIGLQLLQNNVIPLVGCGVGLIIPKAKIDVNFRMNVC